MRAADKSSRIARAWEWTLPPEADDSPEEAAARESTVATWFVNGPFHPHWAWWVVLCIDLINRPGLPPPHLQYPGAEFEVLILSISPDWKPDVDAKPGQVPYLTPPDLTYQFDGIPREKAEEIVGLMVEAIVQGAISPDSDYRERWRQHLDETVKHYREGRH